MHAKVLATLASAVCMYLALPWVPWPGSCLPVMASLPRPRLPTYTQPPAPLCSVPAGGCSQPSPCCPQLWRQHHALTLGLTLTGSPGCCCGASPVLPASSRATPEGPEPAPRLPGATCSGMSPAEGSCAHWQQPVFVKFLLSHSPSAAAALSPFPSTSPCLHLVSLISFWPSSLHFKLHTRQTRWISEGARRRMPKYQKKTFKFFFFFLIIKNLIPFLYSTYSTFSACSWVFT